jgi:hypothetical protein
MNEMKKGFVIAGAAAALLAAGFVSTPINAAKPRMVNCVLSSGGHSCSGGNSCSARKEVSVMTLEECRSAGGRPEALE